MSTRYDTRDGAPAQTMVPPVTGVPATAAAGPIVRNPSEDEPGTAAGVDQELRRLVEGVGWIADAPLFIDERLVEKFFDAVVRPEYEHVGSTLLKATDVEEARSVAKGVKGGFALPSWLSPVLPSFTVNVDATDSTKTANRASTQSQLKPIWNAERQLQELTRLYVQTHQERLVTWDGRVPDDNPWYRQPRDFFRATPRAMAYLDLPPGTKLIPTAAEFANGKVHLLFEELVGRLTSDQGQGPWRRYPDDLGMSPEDLAARRRDYWVSFERTFSATKAMQVIEEAASENGRIQWIDFRLPLSLEGDTLHLHVVPAGRCDVGVFGYNFVRRAFKHGIRIVGTLKSEPDLNVLAIYDA